MSFNEYRLLRETEDLDPDPDYAGTNPQQVPDHGVEIGRPWAARGSAPVRIKVEVVLEWIHTSGTVVDVRGLYDLQVIRIAERRGPMTGSLVVDAPALTGQMAFRPVIIDDILVGDRFTVRLFNLQPPAGLSIARARVLYREIV
jgi:hypothetical protein